MRSGEPHHEHVFVEAQKRCEKKKKVPRRPRRASPGTPPKRDKVAGAHDEHVSGAFPIVGVGASAGGLDAFTQLLAALPLDTGMGFVLVQHLDPDHKSQLTPILARATSLPVHEITNDEPVLPNHVYVIPPGMDLTLVRGVLKVWPRKRTRAPHRPIDSFFESLAEDLRERAVGVVLSGTASDGTLGLEAIKAEGGITLAQDESAKYDSMPKSAVAAGSVDLVLSPAEIASELARIGKHPYIVGQAVLWPTERALSSAKADRARPTPPGDDESDDDEFGDKAQGEPRTDKRDEAGYKKIFLLLANHTGVDFSLYKATTIQRRITRRLVLNKQDSVEGYARLLRGNSQELDALLSRLVRGEEGREGRA